MNTYVAPVSEFTRNPDAAMRPEALLAKIRHAAGDAHTAAIDAHAAALALFGDSILSNMFMLGYAWQRGGVPLSHAAINRAIELNGVAVAANRAAFDSAWRRTSPTRSRPRCVRAPKSCNCMCRNRSSTPSRAAWPT